MKGNQTYRLIVASFFVTLILQVLVLQSIHRIVGHHNDQELIDTQDLQYHSSSHIHYLCDLCLFQLESPELEISTLKIKQPDIIVGKSNNYREKNSYGQEYFSSYLRGPPRQTDYIKII